MKQLTEFVTPFADIAEMTTLARKDLPWLNELRQQALAEFSRQGLPAKKVEDWKYTSLWSLSQLAFNHLPESNDVTLHQCQQLALLDDAYRIVIIDGLFSAEHSLLEYLQEGISITPLSTAFQHVEQTLGQQVDINKLGLNALNTLMMNEGVVITIGDNVKVTKPIELLVINTGKTHQLASHLRHIIDLAAHSQATFIEHYVCLNDDSYFNNVVTEVVLAEHAELHHYKFQQESIDAYHIATLAAKQATHSQWITQNISLGAKLARNDIHTQLLGEQSHVTMNGLYLVKSDQHVDNHTRIDHAVPNTTSEELYKGVLDDKSHAVFNGKVIVHKDAQKTDANQSNRNLLLSRGCEIDSKPEMEIYADDVKCGHGSTVGQLDQDQLFFLRARGLDEVSARSLLTYAFAVEVLERIPNVAIRQALAQVIEQRLPRSGDKV